MALAQSMAPQKVARSLLVVMGAIFIAGVFTLGFDQGHLFSIVQGEAAWDAMYLHELSHDMRHAAGFPCH